MTSAEQAPMEAEFDTVAAWTERIVRDLGPEYAIPAACRGSGSASWLRWIAEGLQLQAGSRFLDAGAGLGGPAAWAREQYGLRPVLAEPMLGACLGAVSLFGLPTVAAWSQALPFQPGAFDRAWLLGVLCTTTEKVLLLRELRRVLETGGRLGLLVLVRVVPELSEQPEGNDFPTPQSLRDDLAAAGFTVDAEIVTDQLPAADEDWIRRVDAAEQALEERYVDKPAWQQAKQQEQRIGRLLKDGSLETWLVCATASGLSDAR